MDEDLLFRDYQDAAMLLRRANCRPEGSVAQEFVEVAKKMESLLELDPEHRGLLLFKADVLYQQRDFEACIAHLSQCAGRVTQNGKSLAGDGADDIWVHDHLTLARCLILQKDIANAM